MFEYVHQMWSGSGHIRGIIQPLLALVIGVIDGLRDHKGGLPPFMGSLSVEGSSRRGRVTEGLRRLLVPLTIAMAASLLFQYVNRAEVHIALAIAYAFLFVAIPYAVARHLANHRASERLARPKDEVPQT